MKNIIKRAVAAAAAAMVVLSLSINVFAEPSPTPRTKPGSSTSTSQSTESKADDNETKKETAAPKRASATQAPETPAQSSTVESKGASKGSVFLWFLLSVIVNTIISFAVANRYYKLSKKTTHVQSEIRALRRDIEEKFVGSVGGFTEPAVDITNTNDDYSSSAEGIKVTPSSYAGSSDEPEDVYKEWEAQFAAKRAERRAAVKARPTAVEDEYDNNEAAQEDDTPRISTRKYQPSRKGSERKSVRERLEERRNSAAIDADNDIDDEDIEEKEGGLMEKVGSVGTKAKNLLSGIFPLGNDDEDDE